MDSTRFSSSPLTIQAAVCSIVWIMWKEGFKRALTDQQMKTVSHMPNNLWIRYEDDLKALLTETLPELHREYLIKDKSMKRKRQVAAIATEASLKARSLKAKLKVRGITVTDSGEITRGFNVIKEKNTVYNNNFTDLIQRNSILQSNKTATTKTFTDK